MQLRTDIDCIVGRYNVQVSTSNFSAAEEAKMANFGEPLIEVGGSFSGSATRPGGNTPVAVTFDLPTSTFRMRSDFPAKQIFDLEDDPDSDIMAKVWADTVTSRLIAAKTALVSMTSPFEGVTVTTV